MSSPLIVQAMGEPSGKLRGKVSSAFAHYLGD